MEQQEPKRDAERTIRAILDAAAAEFADHGFGGARVDRIAEAAGVNKATIYYHIGNKRDLYLQVVRRMIRGVSEQLQRRVESVNDPREQLRLYVRSIVQAVNGKKHIAPILMREFASAAENFPPELGEDLERLFGIVAGILERGYRQGLFIRTSPLVVHLMVMGFSLMFRMTEPVREHVPRLRDLFQQLGAPGAVELSRELEDRVLRSLDIHPNELNNAGGKA